MNPNELAVHWTTKPAILMHLLEEGNLRDRWLKSQGVGEYPIQPSSIQRRVLFLHLYEIFLQVLWPNLCQDLTCAKMQGVLSKATLRG
jgi:hypothetical protein